MSKKNRIFCTVDHRAIIIDRQHPNNDEICALEIERWDYRTIWEVGTECSEPTEYIAVNYPERIEILCPRPIPRKKEYWV